MTLIKRINDYCFGIMGVVTGSFMWYVSLKGICESFYKLENKDIENYALHLSLLAVSSGLLIGGSVMKVLNYPENKMGNSKNLKSILNE